MGNQVAPQLPVRVRSPRTSLTRDSELGIGSGDAPARTNVLGSTGPTAPDDTQREAALAIRLGVQFNDLGLLRLALTHRSILQDAAAAVGVAPSALATLTNERLEFLGDAVLGSVTASYLYEVEPAADEGTLTRKRASMVRAETLVRWAREKQVGECLYLGNGEGPGAGARDRMLAGAFEAIVGAITLDQGYFAAREFLMPYLLREGRDSESTERLTNPKGRLQELMQEQYRLAPDYVTLGSEGPAHERVFTVAVRLGDRLLGSGSGASKREAQQVAAAAALEVLEQEPIGNFTV